MKHTGSKNIEDLVEKQLSLWQAAKRAHEEARRKEERDGGGRFIAISREAGTNGKDVARILAERLGWKVYDSEIVEYISTRASIHQDLIHTLDEATRDFITDAVMTLFESVEHREFGASGYREALTRTLLAISHHGEAVIVGRGSNIVLGANLGGLRVRLVAPISERVAQIVRNEELGNSEAEKRVRQLDRERRSFIKKQFSRDIDDPLLYDLIINISGLTLEKTVDLIYRAAKAKIKSV